jgi:amidohydrolase
MHTLDEARALEDQLVAWRRDFHRHPEIGLKEHRTAGIVAETLRGLGYRVREGVAETGVIGVLENGEGPVVMNRVDMDALPIQETNDVPYASENAGLMHACGHDGHLAMGLGIATLMAQQRRAWRGTLKLIFQPGEEGMNGAQRMIDEGALENPRPEVALALHVWNTLPVGTFGVASGPVMAASEAWKAEILGKGGHAALPEHTVDPVVIAAMTVNNLQTVVSRNVGPRETAVVSVGQILAGDTFNVIPERAEIQGTIRTFDPAVRKTVLHRVRKIIKGTVAMMDARATLEFMTSTPPVVNDEVVTGVIRDVVGDLFGTDTLEEERTMGSEDAAFFLQEVPGCYIFVGSGFRDQVAPPHHNPKFDIDEAALVNGVALTVASLCRLMPSAVPSEGK